MQQIPLSRRDRLLLCAWVCTLATLLATSADASDAPWMAREGLDVLRGSPLVHPDHWSWAPVANPFVPTSPGWDVVLGAFWRLAGLPGLFILSALSTAVTLAAVALASRALGAGMGATLTATTAAALGAQPILTPRGAAPALAILIVAIVLSWRLLGARAATLPTVLGVGGITAGSAYVGIWVHGSWTALAPGLGLAVAALALASHGRPAAARGLLALVAAVASMVGAVAGPLGLGAWSNAARVASVARGRIIEWAGVAQMGWGERTYWGALAVVVILLAMRFRRSARADGAPLAAILLGGAAAAVLAGAFSQRFTPTAGLLAPPVLAWVLATPPARWTQWQTRYERLRAAYWRPVPWLVLPILVLGAAIGVAGQPWAEDPALHLLPQGCHLFSSDGAAKSIPLLRPDVLVWFDGRQDYWGAARIDADLAYRAAEGGQARVPTGTTCIMLGRRDADPLAAALDHSTAWRRAGSSAAFTVWVPAAPRVPAPAASGG